MERIVQVALFAMSDNFKRVWQRQTCSRGLTVVPFKRPFLPPLQTGSGERQAAKRAGSKCRENRVVSRYEIDLCTDGDAQSCGVPAAD